MKDDASPARVHLALALVQVIFSGNAIVGRIALSHLSASAVLAVRIPSAALLFLGLRWAYARRAGWQSADRRDLWKLGLEYIFYASRNDYDGMPDVNVSAPEFRASLAFDVD